jgi:hypothetical protein
MLVLLSHTDTNTDTNTRYRSEGLKQARFQAMGQLDSTCCTAPHHALFARLARGVEARHARLIVAVHVAFEKANFVVKTGRSLYSFKGWVTKPGAF